MAFNCGTRDLRLQNKTKLARKGNDFLFEAEQQLQRDVKKVAAAASRVKHRDRWKVVFEIWRARSRCAALPLPFA